VFSVFACSGLQPQPSNDTIPTNAVVQSNTEEGETEPSFVVITYENMDLLSEVYTIDGGKLLYSPDSTLIAVPTDGFIGLLDAITLEELARLVITAEDYAGSRILDFEFSPDGKVLASANSDGQVRLFSIPDGALISTLSACKSMTITDSLTVDFLPEDPILVSSCINGTINLWDIQTGEIRNSFNIDNTDGSISIINNGDLLAVAFGNQFVIEGPSGKAPTTLLYQIETGALVAELEGFLYDVSPNQTLISTIQANIVRVYSNSSELLHQSEYIFEQLNVPLTVYSADFSADNSRLIIRTDDQSTHVLDSLTGERIYVIEPIELVRYIGDKVLIIESEDSVLEMQRISDRSVINTFVLEAETAAQIANGWITLLYDEEKSTLALLSQNETNGDDIITLVNSQTGETLGTLEFTISSDLLFRELFFSQDSRFLFFVTGLGKVLVLGVLD
jgi:WD40 repeat protein